MSKTDWIGVGVNLIVAGFGYLIGGPVAAIILLVIGAAILAVHARRDSGEVGMQTQILGDISIPDNPMSLPAPALSTLPDLRAEWHELARRFESRDWLHAYAMWDEYTDGGGGVWAIVGCGDDIQNKALQATMEEAGNLLLISSFALPQVARETDAIDRWLVTASSLTGHPPQWCGATTGTAVRHSKSAVLKKVALVSALACKQLAAKETATSVNSLTVISHLPARIEITNLTRRVWPLERHGFTGAEYYIDIFNGSDIESLEGARVELVALSPDAIGFLPVPLHIKHSDYETREFSINPRSIRQIDILTGPINHPRSQKEMIIPHTVNRERFPLPRDNYRMTIRASARNATPVEAVFDAWIDKDGELRCVRVRLP